MSEINAELESKAHLSGLEVEDILDAAKRGDDETPYVLERLSSELGWLDTKAAREAGKVPLGAWAEVAAAFLRGGCEALSRQSIDEHGYTDKAPFVLALLEYLHTEPATECLLRIFKEAFKNPAVNLYIEKRIVSALNLILSFPPEINLSAEKTQIIREFLHRHLENGADNEFRALIYCALRGVGDQTSIALINKEDPLIGQWSGIERSIINSIKKRE